MGQFQCFEVKRPGGAGAGVEGDVALPICFLELYTYNDENSKNKSGAGFVVKQAVQTVQGLIVGEGTHPQPDAVPVSMEVTARRGGMSGAAALGLNFCSCELSHHSPISHLTGSPGTQISITVYSYHWECALWASWVPLSVCASGVQGCPSGLCLPCSWHQVPPRWLPS